MLTLLGVSLDIEQFKSSTLEMDLLDFFSNNLVTLQSDWLGEGEDMEPWGREELRPIGEEVLGEEVETFISTLFLLPIEILETGTLAYLRGGGDGVVISSIKSSSSTSILFVSWSSSGRLKSICFFIW